MYTRTAQIIKRHISTHISSVLLLLLLIISVAIFKICRVHGPDFRGATHTKVYLKILEKLKYNKNSHCVISDITRLSQVLQKKFAKQ